MSKRKIFSKIVITVLILLFLILFLLITVFYFRYSSWFKEVFSEERKGSSEIICLDHLYDTVELSDEELNESIEKKIKNFTLSDSRTDFVVFTKQEFLYLLSNNSEDTEESSVENLCIYPSHEVWQIYIKYEAGNFSTPWVVLDIIKDNFETAQLYVGDIRIGGMEIPGFLTRKIKEDLNKGISDAIILLNENNLLGRRISNIELLEDKIVFKGTK